MIIPRPLPDEIDDGYCGRVQFLNGIKSREQLFKKLREHFGADKDHSRLALTSEAMGLQFTEMLRGHTLIPLEYGFVGGRVSSKWFEHDTPIAKININWVHSYEVRYCHKCIDQDISRHGVSFWHRRHHIYGVNRCLEHGEVLRYSCVGEQEQKFMSSPLDVDLEKWKYGSVFDSVIPEEDEYVNRYGSVCFGYMQRDSVESDTRFLERIMGCTPIETPVTTKEINEFLRHIASKTISRPSASWLEKYFPRFKLMYLSRSRMTFDAISNPGRRLAKNSHYALVEALSKDINY